MCGRFVLTTPAEALAREFAALAVDAGLVLRPRYNIAPMQDLVVVRSGDDGRRLSMMRWGLVPSWAKDPSIASRLTNARSETVAEKPSFRGAIRKRRAVVPASGFYEWKREGTHKQPWYFFPARHTPPATSALAATLAMAALWESWRTPDGGLLETCCLLTTAANTTMRPVHDRMPVLLSSTGVNRWLDPSITDPRVLADLLVPAPDDGLEAHAVTTSVGNVRNDEARNIEPMAETEPGLPF
jgi:putative SOS response-associated peptidase YedK